MVERSQTEVVESTDSITTDITDQTKVDHLKETLNKVKE